MKSKYAFKKIFDKMPEEEKAEMLSIINEHGKEVDDLSVERKTYAGEIKAEDISGDDEERWAIKYVSTRDVDSIGDVVIPKGVILKEFERTGKPFFWGHDISMPPLGSDEWVKADAYGIKVKSVYANTGEGTIADIVWKLVKQGHQKQSSVGIIVLDAVEKGTKEFNALDRELVKEYPEYRKNRKYARRIITKSIMFEHSDVGIGMNNNTDVIAISKMWKDEGADDEILKKVGLYTDSLEQEVSNVINDMVDTQVVEKSEDESKSKSDIVPTEVIPLEDTENIENIEDSEVVEVKRYTRLIKNPTYVKVVKKPDVDIKSLVDREIRRKMGRLV